MMNARLGTHILKTYLYYLKVYDGSTVYHPLLMEKSGNVSSLFAVNSSSKEVLVRFTTSDVGKSFNGFLAVYSTV